MIILMNNLSHISLVGAALIYYLSDIYHRFPSYLSVCSFAIIGSFIPLFGGKMMGLKSNLRYTLGGLYARYWDYIYSSLD